MHLSRPQEFQKTSTDSSWSSATKLSRKVRELAQRSHHALQTSTPLEDRAQPRHDNPAEDLRDLRNQIAQLQSRIVARRLTALVPWVDALRRRVDARLETMERREQHENADT